MSSDTNESKLDAVSLGIASTIWIISSIGLFIDQLFPSLLTKLLVEGGVSIFLVLSYWILFPICIVISLIALIKRSGSSINCIGALMLAAPPVCYIIYSAVQLHLQQGNA